MFKSIFFAAVLLFGITACQKDQDESANPQPPQQQLPNPLPANALIKQLKWAENDHSTFLYNAQNQVTQLRNQWQFVQGDPTQIQKNVYDFQYDAQNRPAQLTKTGGQVAKYFYQGNLVKKTKELYPNGTLLSEANYFYANGRIVQQIQKRNDVPGLPVRTYKYVYSYDAKGNLNKIEMYELQVNLAFALIDTREYSDFDDKVNPTSWTLQYPFLPQVRWQFNNPRKEVYKPSNGIAHITTYSYEYDNQGLPKVQRKSTEGGVLTGQYFY